jgi:hypothetical protein
VVLGGDFDGVLQCVDEAGEMLDLLGDAAEPLRRCLLPGWFCSAVRMKRAEEDLRPSVGIGREMRCAGLRLWTPLRSARMTRKCF